MTEIELLGGARDGERFALNHDIDESPSTLRFFTPKMVAMIAYGDPSPSADDPANVVDYARTPYVREDGALVYILIP